MKTERMELTQTQAESGAAPGALEENQDAILVRRVLQGDSNAFEPLVRRHQAALFRRARWMGLDEDTAADMVQDALIKAYQNLKSCRDANRFAYWAGRILRNQVLDFLKSADRRRAPLPTSLAADTGDPEREEARSALHSVLQRALSLLPDEQREAFLLKHAEGCSYEEMAEFAGTSVSAMKMRVHRARETLREHLHGQGFDDEM